MTLLINIHMKIQEIIRENTTMAAAPAAAPVANNSPPPEEIKAVQDIIGTIDPKKEKPQGLLKKLMSWMDQHPYFDLITDLIPQTRVVKGLARAIDYIQSGDQKSALASLGGILSGPTGKIVGAVSSLAQGDMAGAVSNAVGGRAGQMLGSINAVRDLAQPSLLDGPATVAQTPDEVERLKQLAAV
jgi:hypothetical protein